ncbi:NADH:flavin oxidoreductase [Ancylomarina sp. 16SWW S1-10-2]|uniref:NADH:flavin oxidoreductase n=1 Tax=Ancylomarina sp. 16SWW S1-10-2 TaxID=2499681 RepID=UPI0012AD4629|nr:NADH:flavin oxidoreductase [Ancylomarina sp. 16SWW S1-10-2]MRT92900.1 NADH:flavin oxidoreductase [Ancylomarina sp. 16SWW S1-10-2]
MNSKEAFKPALIGGIELKNRFVRSATSDPIAENNAPSQEIINKYEKLCEGELGLIIMGYLVFSKTDHYSEKDLSMNNDTISGFKKVTDMAHNYGTKIVAQLNHNSTQLFFKPEGNVYGPSEYTDPVSGIMATAFSKEQIHELIKEYGQAAACAKDAGFDGVQLHAAHGYMLNKFLSPVFNKRTDEYGGDLERRMQIVIDILREIKNVCGSDFPVGIKLNSSDFDSEDKGVNEADFLVISENLSLKGINSIEVSGGTLAGVYSFSRAKKHSAYHFASAKRLSEIITTSVILVGGLRDVDEIETILNDTNIAAVSLSRPLIRELDLVKRWMNGDRSKAKCVACNGCFNHKGVQCFFTLSKEEQDVQRPVMKMMQSNN